MVGLRGVVARSWMEGHCVQFFIVRGLAMLRGFRWLKTEERAADSVCHAASLQGHLFGLRH